MLASKVDTIVGSAAYLNTESESCVVVDSTYCAEDVAHRPMKSGRPEGREALEAADDWDSQAEGESSGREGETLR
jgi:hypothetical protein